MLRKVSIPSFSINSISLNLRPLMWKRSKQGKGVVFHSSRFNSFSYSRKFPSEAFEVLRAIFGNLADLTPKLFDESFSIIAELLILCTIYSTKNAQSSRMYLSKYDEAQSKKVPHKKLPYCGQQKITE